MKVVKDKRLRIKEALYAVKDLVLDDVMCIELGLELALGCGDRRWWA